MLFTSCSRNKILILNSTIQESKMLLWLLVVVTVIKVSQSTAPPTAGPTVATTMQFFVNGEISQSWTVPAGVSSISVDAAGAAGGCNDGVHQGGKGALVKTTIAVTPGNPCLISVGGLGGAPSGGFFGGGDGKICLP